MYRCAIIGCGKIAGGYDKEVPEHWSFTHAGAYHLCPDTELVAASDIDRYALRSFLEKWKIENLYEDYREMLEKEKIDILSICLPTDRHYEVFKFACGKKIPAIFCEKPLSYDLNEGREMVRMSGNRIVSVNYFRRWDLTLAKLCTEIRNGFYGRVKNVVARYSKGIIVNGSHLVDLARWFLGEPEELTALRIHQPDDIDPGVDFILSFKGGTYMYFLHIPDITYTFIDIDILTDKGRVVIGQRGQSISRYNIITEPYSQKFNILKHVEDIETEWRYCIIRAVQEIVDILKNGGKTSCTPEDALKSLNICVEIQKRQREHGSKKTK